MARFRFRLQKVLDYRTGLVEAQQAEVGRRLMSLRRAEEELAGIRAKQKQALHAMREKHVARLDAGRAVIQWSYLDVLRRRETACLEKTIRLSQKLADAREKLAQLKQEEQAMEKLKGRQQRRAEVAARLRETKELDDLTATRFRVGEQEVMLG